MNQKIHILHLISSLNRGGRERQLATIYKFSDKTRVSTTIVCLNRTASTYIEEYNMSADIIFLSSKSFLSRFRELRKIVREKGVDLIWTWGGIEATLGLMVSSSTAAEHVNGSIRHGIVRFDKHQLWRMLVLHLSKNIVANSYAGLKANKISKGRVLYNGIDSSFFAGPEKERLATRKEFGLGENSIVLISVANLVPYKDYDTILNALGSLSAAGIPFHYLAIGEGPERTRIETLAGKLGLTDYVTFPGNRTDVKELLYASDIFLHSSLGEGCSNAILEAMAAGLPIIATNTGGTSEIVSSTIGRLFEFQHAEQLINAIREMIFDQPLRKELSENSKNKAVSFFSIEQMMSNYNKIIEGLCR